MTASGQDPVASRQLQDPPLGRPHSTAPRIPRALAVRDSLFDNAQHILDLVNARFGGGDAYLDQIYGPCITVDQANKIVVRHLKEEGLHGHIKVKWSPKLSCSACIVFRGYSRKLNKPEKRSYTLMLNSTKDNLYLREKAILALIDHEIGTHYIRAHNEGLQVWYSERTKFQLSSPHSYRSLLTEEGLATLNTHLRLECKLLWMPALLYYAACMASRMDSDQLYHHLSNYIDDHKFRSKIVFRVKRRSRSGRPPLLDAQGERCSTEESGCGWDQCYFTGAIKILRRLCEVDLSLLYSGRLAVEDLDRVKRIARISIIKLPWFLWSSEGGLGPCSGGGGGQVATYEQTLWQIKRVNSYPDGEC